MATTKIWKVVKRLDHVMEYATDEIKTKNIEFRVEKGNYLVLVNDLKDVLDYATNSDKTEKQYYTTGINCEVNSAYEEMMDTKMYFQNEGGILGFHAYQSFKENISPEEAHQIGIQSAKEMWGDRFQVVVTTHLNTDHIHNHFVINSVSFVDGYRYYSNRYNTARFRHISDEICKEHGLSVLPEKPCKKSKINFDNYYKKSLHNDNYSKIAKREIDLAIRQAYSYDDFIYLMKKLDYEVMVRAGGLSMENVTNEQIIMVRAGGLSMENVTNEQINRVLGAIFQEYRIKNKLTQEKLAEELSKSTKTISQLETAKDGTSKKTDIDLMNTLGITPNILYKDFITNPDIKSKIEISEKIEELDADKIRALYIIIEAIKNL